MGSGASAHQSSNASAFVDEKRDEIVLLEQPEVVLESCFLNAHACTILLNSLRSGKTKKLFVRDVNFFWDKSQMLEAFKVSELESLRIEGDFGGIVSVLSELECGTLKEFGLINCPDRSFVELMMQSDLIR